MLLPLTVTMPPRFLTPFNRPIRSRSVPRLLSGKPSWVREPLMSRERISKERPPCMACHCREQEPLLKNPLPTWEATRTIPLLSSLKLKRPGKRYWIASAVLLRRKKLHRQFGKRPIPNWQSNIITLLKANCPRSILLPLSKKPVQPHVEQQELFLLPW